MNENNTEPLTRQQMMDISPRFAMREISRDVIALFDEIERQKGPITPEQGELLDRLREMLIAKTDRVGDHLAKLDSQIREIRDEEHRLAERRKRLQQMIERMESYIVSCMERMDDLVFKGNLHTFGLRTAPEMLVIESEELVAESMPEAVVNTVVRTLDKKAITAALKSGIEVPGASLVAERYLRRS